MENMISALKEDIRAEQERLSQVQHKHLEELRNQKELIQALQIQSSEKESLLAQYEKKLESTNQKLAGESSDATNRLNQAFEIAASLRKLLDEKETQILQLKRSKDQQDLQIQHYATRLEEARELLSLKDEQIKELQDQLDSIQDTSKDYIQLLERKDSQLQRLSKELQRRNEQEHSQDLSYLYSDFPSVDRVRHGYPLDSSYSDVKSDISKPASKNNTKLRYDELDAIYDEINSLQRKITARLVASPPHLRP